MERPGEKTDSRPKSPGVPPTAARPNSNAEIGAFVQLILIAATGSLIVALYVLLIGVLNRTKSNIDATAQAALYAASELSQIHVESPNFGKVGLCDRDLQEFSGYGLTSTHYTGIDTIYRTLEIDQSISERLHSEIMLNMVAKDFESAKKTESQLTERLFAAAQPELLTGSSAAQPPINANTASNIYHTVYRMLSFDRASKDNSLIEVHIKLGNMKPGVVLHDDGPNGGGIRIIDNSLFEMSDQKRAPNAVLIEGVFQSKNANEAPIRTVTSSRCALIRGKAINPPPSTFLLYFPDGRPQQFDSVQSILGHNKWNDNGYWQQAVGSEVPGRGSLAPSLEPVLPEMNPAEALSIELYHWLRRLGGNVDADKFLALLNRKWQTVPVHTLPLHRLIGNEPNSCLAVDTGAREYAILNQTAPGGAGQLALCRAFAVPTTGNLSEPNASAQFPPSAIPLYVDNNGICNLSGRKGFDNKLIADFLGNVYKTNLAAVESLAVAKAAIARITSTLTQLDQKIFIEKQELTSVINRLERLRFDAANKAADPTFDSKEATRKIDLAANTVETLKSSIVDDEDERKASRHVNDLATVTLDNATRVANETYEMCAQSFRFCKDGIWRINAPFDGYLISRRYVFMPFVHPVAASDFFGSVDEMTETKRYWFNRKNRVLEDATAKDSINDFVVEGVRWHEFAAQPAEVQKSPTPEAIFLTSDGLSQSDKTGAARPFSLASYPFDNLRLPSGQLLYYCQNALSTGNGNPDVSWSVLIRDFVASRAQSNKGRETGLPVASEHSEWCKMPSGERTDCPGLAAEFQLRTPLPKSSQLSEGAYLTNPVNNAQVPQIPPVPADLL